MTSDSWASSPAVRRSMQGNRRRDTSLELKLRSALHRMGLRFRVDAKPLPQLNRRADILFRPARVAVFAHGCFWHGCSQHFKVPKTNPTYWTHKIESNRRRDSQTLSALVDDGWEVVVVWEHDDPLDAASSIRTLVNRRRRTAPPS